MSQGLTEGLRSVIVSSWENGMSVDIVFANKLHHRAHDLTPRTKSGYLDPRGG